MAIDRRSRPAWHHRKMDPNLSVAVALGAFFIWALVIWNRLLAHGNGHEAAAPAGGVDIHAIEADVRDRSAAITQRLSDAPTQETDAALREDMADIAAKMIVLTDAREGAASPLRSLLDQAPPASDPRRLSLASSLEPDRLAVQSQFTLKVGNHARQNLHQRALARSVLTANRVQLAAHHLQRHICQRRHAGKAFGYVLNGDDGMHR